MKPSPQEIPEEAERLFGIGSGQLPKNMRDWNQTHWIRALLPLARAGVEAQWRPIETAPKDGTRILCPGGILHWSDPAGWSLEAGWFDGYHRYSPTLWMPLPAPPSGDAFG